MANTSPVKFIASHFVLFLSGTAVLFGLLLLSFAARMPEASFQGMAKGNINDGGVIVVGVNAEQLPEHGFGRDLARDLGIAFLVAAIVTAIYEVHARSRFDLETMTGILDVAMGDIVRPDIWQEVKGHVIEKDMIREKVNIHITVERINDAPGLATLKMDFEYDLFGLHSKPKTGIKLMHYLDAHIRHGEFPRFDFIQIGDKPYPVTPLPTANIKDGRFTETVDLGAKDGNALRVMTKRTEITYLPGSYNLAMGELTKGITIRLVKIPKEIEVSVNIRPHTEYGVTLKEDDPLRDFEKTLLLPGQAIEFRFKDTSLLKGVSQEETAAAIPEAHAPAAPPDTKSPPPAPGV